MAEEAKRIGAVLVQFSTDYVFDGTKAEPYTEDDRPNPLNVYGRTKLDGEKAVEASGARYLILRTSWVYSSRGRNFVRAILERASTTDDLRVVCDQVGAPTWSREIARGLRENGLKAARDRGNPAHDCRWLLQLVRLCHRTPGRGDAVEESPGVPGSSR
jgi:dTDP-4-dehydrorhamnose reductase